MVPPHHRPRDPRFVGRLCLEVRELLAEGRRLDAIRVVRTWRVAGGMGDSFEAAKNFVRDVADRQPWIERSIKRIKT